MCVPSGQTFQLVRKILPRDLDFNFRPDFENETKTFSQLLQHRLQKLEQCGCTSPAMQTI